MITETHTYCCGKCGSQKIMLNGHNRCGNQQYLCKDCKTCRVLQPKAAPYSEERKEEILRIYQERSSMRGVERATGVSRHTLSSWIKKSLSLTEHRRDPASSRARGCAGTPVRCGHLFSDAITNAGFGQRYAEERDRLLLPLWATVV